jgi:hypothetical protein
LSATNNDFKRRIDCVLAGTYPSGELVPVCLTPQLIQDVGFNPLVMAMKQRHIRDILKPERIGNGGNTHGLNREFLDNLPNHIAEPAMILNSRSHPESSIVLVSDKTDTGNRPIIIALLSNGTGMINKQNIYCNIVTSAYGRNDFKTFIECCCNENKVIYYNEKKSQVLADTIRVQFPQALTKLNSSTIIHRFKVNVNSLDKNYLDKPPTFAEVAAATKNVRPATLINNTKKNDGKPTGNGTGSRGR